MITMLGKFFGWLRSWWPEPAPLAAPTKPTPAGKIERVVLTEQVARTLFDDFASHRRTMRGEEEIGWVLLGIRDGADVVALATLPAGAQRDAGVAHVLFNSDAQAVACRMLRQLDRRLVMIGMVHTHPGSMRHPSGGDYEGDIAWVGRLRGGEGVFGIGTADAEGELPASYQQIEGDLCFSWYALGRDDRSFRRLQVVVRPGDDLARPLHPVWADLEEFAPALERLAGQLAGVVFEAVQGAIVVSIKLATPGHRLRIVLQNDQARYYVEQGPLVSAVDPEEPSVERAVYLILAELAKPAAQAATSAGWR
jgi:hypothetical protein